MSTRLIETLGVKNKQRLRKEFQFKTIRQAKRELGVETDAEAYEIMQDAYNQALVEFRRGEKERKAATRFKEKVMEVSAGDNIHSILKNMAGQSIVIHMMNGNTTIKTRQDDIPAAKFENWWKKTGWFIFNDGTGEGDKFFHHYPNGKIYIWRQNENVKKSLIKQYFKDGSVNCLLGPISKWIDDKLNNAVSVGSKKRYNALSNRMKKLMNKYTDSGVDENAINDISNELQLDISIDKPLCDKKYIESKSDKKPLKHFRFLNTRCNHVELDEIVNESEYITLSREEMMELGEKLDKENKFFHYKRDNISFCKITTIDGVYRLSNNFYDMVNEFEKINGLNECKIDDISDKELSRFIKSGTHYNATIDFEDIKQIDYTRLKHMDMEKAYTKYLLCKFYEGFLGKITDFRKCDKIEGVGLYQITDLIIPDGKLNDLNKKMRVYVNNNVYPSPELKMLKSYGCSFKIICGAWGRETLELNVDLDVDYMLEKHDGISGYAKYVGLCDSHHLEKKTFMRGNEDMFSLISENASGNVKIFHNGEIAVSYPKKSNYHLGHFAAFILAYQRMNAMEQLISIDINNLLRICVDGIYHYGDEKMLNCFRDKSSQIKLGNECGDSYISDIYDNLNFNCGDMREYYNTELHIGEGGNGKTHMNLMDKGLIKPLYVAPSWKLATKKYQEYGVNSQVWANICSEDPEKVKGIKRYNTLIIDEVSMMNENQKEFIFDTYKNMKLIFCGDVGYQAPPFVTGSIEITNKGFDKIIEHKKNYRFKCDLLVQLIKDVRLMIDFGRPNYDVNNHIKEYLKERIITHEELKKLYKVEDMILVRYNEELQKDINDNKTTGSVELYNNMFADYDKWFVKTNSRKYKNGEIIIGDKPDTICLKQQAFTIHSIQGETAKYKLFIDVEKCYDSRIIYTAISRATTLDQIYLVKNN